MSEKIILTEVGPRDGWQSIKEFIPTQTKLAIIRDIIDAGVQHIQITSFVSPKAIPQMSDAKEIVETVLEEYPHINFYALVPNLRGAKAAIDCGLKAISTVISVSETHNKANINRTVDESMEDLKVMRQEFPEIELTLDVATAFGCTLEGETSVDSLIRYLAKAAAVGVDRFNLCDTIGIAYPTQVRAMLKAVTAHFPKMPLEIHIHDTRNMGLLNTWAAIEFGVHRIQTSLGGIGGCPFALNASGNAATEDMVYLLDRCGMDTGINFDKILQAARNMKKDVVGNYSGHHVHIASPSCTKSA